MTVFLERICFFWLQLNIGYPKIFIKYHILIKREIVLAAVQDDGWKYIGYAVRQLKRLGARRIGFGFRGSFAFVGYAGTGKRPGWVRQVQRRRRQGPSALSTVIALGKTQKGKMWFFKVLLVTYLITRLFTEFISPQYKASSEVFHIWNSDWLTV